MPNFSLREQLLIALVLFIIILLFGTWGIQKINLQKKNLLQQYEKKEIQIKQIRNLSKDWYKLQSSRTAPLMLQDLSSFIENVARSLEIQDNLQLNVLTNVRKGTEGVKVGLDRLKLDQFLSMLYELENHRPVLNTSNLKISISPGSRLIRASFHVLKQLGG